MLNKSSIGNEVLNKNYIIEQAQKAEQKHWAQGVKFHDSSEVTLKTLKESDNILEQSETAEERK